VELRKPVTPPPNLDRVTIRGRATKSEVRMSKMTHAAQAGSHLSVAEGPLSRW
jgi:hypothetical protein